MGTPLGPKYIPYSYMDTFGRVGLIIPILRARGRGGGERRSDHNLSSNRSGEGDVSPTHPSAVRFPWPVLGGVPELGPPLRV